MRIATYAFIGLLFSSLLFVGSSFADTGEMAIQWDSFPATLLLGRDLSTPAGDYIGYIDDLAINPSTGQIDSVLVNHVIGLGAEVIAIPFDSSSKQVKHFLITSLLKVCLGFLMHNCPI